MTGKTKTRAANNLRAWREHRKMSQVKLAELADTTPSTISELESGHTQLSDKWLRRLAPHLGIRAGLLLDYQPSDVDPEYLEAVMAVPGERVREATEILRTISRRR